MPVLAAVIGVGSNSVRLLVAQLEEEGLRPVLRDRCGTRLFAGLQGGVLSQPSMDACCQAVCRMTRRAREAGVETPWAFGTSAVRDAVNGQVFCDMLRRQAGVDLQICSGEEEALLSYWGAAQPGLCGLIDIGGGSTEYVIGCDGTPWAAVSLQMGGVRLMRQIAIRNAGDVPAAVAAADAVLRGGLHAFANASNPAVWVGVGGTFTTLAAMDMRLASFDRSLVEGYPLTAARIAHWADTLADMPLDVRRTLPGLQPQRADIVVHGIAILLASMRLWDIGTIFASDHGNLDGYLRRMARR
jgi:exopolyphosphatase/guanosine-5'-triphosphate,3'-diphosphate pyrophosphatase